jgi:hypothetical protein
MAARKQKIAYDRVGSGEKVLLISGFPQTRRSWNRRPYFEDVMSIVIADSGHFVPEEQPEALAKALLAFL